MTRRWVRIASLAAVIALPAVAHAGDPGREAGRIVDLSHDFDAETIYWPTEEGFVLERGDEGVTERGYYYAAHRFRGAEHGGTHIDAPIHFHAGGWTVDEIPVDRLVGPGIRIDVSAACAKDRDYQVLTADFLAWEQSHGRIPDGAIVLIDTGFAAAWPDRKRYLGTDERGAAAVAKLHFPGLHPDAARWLVRERRPGAVGLDTASIDHGQTRLYGSHVELFTHDVPAFENVANLQLLPPTGAWIVALPMKIGGGSGAPVRMAAWLPE
jgi:kynurenine formamidase